MRRSWAWAVCGCVLASTARGAPAGPGDGQGPLCGAGAAASECAAAPEAPSWAADSVLIQRAWRAAEAGVDPERGAVTNAHEPRIGVAAAVVASADYDCNGDGEPDCGRWNYQMSMCHNQHYCGRIFRLGDWTLGQSCRCRRCHQKELHGTAFGDTKLQRPEVGGFDALSWGTFKTWADHLDTCAPWLMPRNDGELKKVLAYARERGYTVRISGAAHSAGGLVTDGTDHSVFVVSLAEYTAEGDWEYRIRSMPDGSQRATVNAGWTLAHLSARIRPLRFFLPTQPAGYFFQLGGVVANSVHGGAYERGFLHSYVTRLRVMFHDGSIRVVEDEADLRYWRSSYGLLGIILGIEFQLERREELQMYTVTRKMPAWSEKELWRFIKRYGEADLPAHVGSAGGNSTRRSFSGEFFLEFLGDEHFPTMMVYGQKANHSVDIWFEGELGVPANVHANYHGMLTQAVTDDWHGRMSWGEAARRDGSPPLQVAVESVSDMLEQLRARGSAKQLSRSAMERVPELVGEMSGKVNDGFWESEARAAASAAYFVHPSNAFAALERLRQMQRASLGSKQFVWNLPGEFRFVKVTDAAVLQPVEAGLWVVVQLLSFEDLAGNYEAWAKEFGHIEDYLVNKLGAKPHLGKTWGFDVADDRGTVKPFSDAPACHMYSDATKNLFDSYRRKQDPHGLFYSGLGTKLLRPCKV